MDQRARELPWLYTDKVRRIDVKYCGSLPGQTGPLQQRLESFGDLLCLVAGQYGDVSQDFHALLDKLAKAQALQISNREGRVVSENELGLLLHQLRRRLSLPTPEQIIKFNIRKNTRQTEGLWKPTGSDQVYLYCRVIEYST